MSQLHTNTVAGNHEKPNLLSTHSACWEISPLPHKQGTVYSKAHPSLWTCHLSLFEQPHTITHWYATIGSVPQWFYSVGTNARAKVPGPSHLSEPTPQGPTPWGKQEATAGC